MEQSAEDRRRGAKAELASGQGSLPPNGGVSAAERRGDGGGVRPPRVGGGEHARVERDFGGVERAHRREASRRAGGGDDAGDA